MTSTSSTSDRTRETAETARREGQTLAHHTADAGRDVAQTVADRAGTVAGEAKTQAQDLFGTAKSEVSDQVDSQRRRLVDVLRTTGQELGNTGDDQSALTGELTRRASEQARRFADYLDQHGPDDIITDVRRFARQRPGTFLLIAGLAGVAAGRVFRGVTAADENAGRSQFTGNQSSGPRFSEPTPVASDPYLVGPGGIAPEPVVPVPTSHPTGIAEVPPVHGDPYATDVYPGTPVTDVYGVETPGYPPAPPTAPAAAGVPAPSPTLYTDPAVTERPDQRDGRP